MFKTNFQKFETVANFIHNSVVGKKNIIVFVGNSGTYLGAISNNKCIDNLFIPIEDRNNVELYKYFFKKYNKFYVFFLYDDDSCELRHELIPVLQSVVKINPIEKFIDEHFLSSDIIAYHVYNISTKGSEVWNSLIVKAPYQPPLSDLINYILENSLRFGGIYYLNLEYITIIDKILEKSKKLEFVKHFQVFAYITKANAIKFVIKNEDDIISVKTVPYPVDRTELYVQGIIEQEVSDYLISFKNYIQKNNLKVCMIFLANEKLKSLLQQSKFESHQVLCISPLEIADNNSVNDDEFSDRVLIELFANNKTYPAVNKSIKSITQINLVNFLMFKPLGVLIAILILILINIKFLTVRSIQRAQILDSQNYQIIEEYRNIKQKYPAIKNVANLADLYSLTALLKIPVITPFDFLEKFLNSLTPNIQLQMVSWKLNDFNKNVLAKDYINIDISFKYIIENVSNEQAVANLNLYIENLKKDFKNFTINYRTPIDVTNILDRVVIPVTFTVIGPREL